MILDDEFIKNDFNVQIRLTDLQVAKVKELMCLMPEQGTPENETDFQEFLSQIVSACLSQVVLTPEVRCFTWWLNENIALFSGKPSEEMKRAIFGA